MFFDNFNDNVNNSNDSDYVRNIFKKRVEMEIMGSLQIGS